MEIDDKPQDPKKDLELKELGRVSWTSAEHQPFLKGVQWSLDGNTLLTAVNGQGMKLIDLPRDLQAEGKDKCKLQ